MGPTICIVDVIKIWILAYKIAEIMLFKNVCAHVDIFPGDLAEAEGLIFCLPGWVLGILLAIILCEFIK